MFGRNKSSKQNTRDWSSKTNSNTEAGSDMNRKYTKRANSKNAKKSSRE